MSFGVVAAALLPAPARAATSSTTSTNWAGYAVTRSGVRFRRVSGSWVVPAADCSGGNSGYSSTWVGLGGFRTSSRGLEQTGVDADCTPGGRAVYSAWYELLPAGAVTVHMGLHAGDRIEAAVTVRGHDVRLTLRNLATGGSFTRARRMSSPDLSSAEWIVEAPATCSSSGDCRDLPLSDFGAIAFSRASATTTAGRSGSVSSPLWNSTSITLGQPTRRVGFPASASSGATPSSLSSSGSSFSVTYQQQAATGGGQPVTLPGGGPP